MLNGATRFRSAHQELEQRWIDVAYVGLNRDPMKVVRHIYGRFGWPLEQTAVNEMEAWLSWQADLRGRDRRHSYRLKDFGLSAGEVNAAFHPISILLRDRGFTLHLPVVVDAFPFAVGSRRLRAGQSRPRAAGDRCRLERNREFTVRMGTCSCRR